MHQQWRLRPMLWVGGVLWWLGLGGGAAAWHVGARAPTFSLPAPTAEHVSLADYVGHQPVVLCFSIAAFGRAWTADALACQLALPEFEAFNAQVLGMRVDWNGAKTAWAQEMGGTYPLLSDRSRRTTKADGVLADAPGMAAHPQQIPRYLRAKGAWFVIEQAGVIRAAKIVPRHEPIATAEIRHVLRAWHTPSPTVGGRNWRPSRAQRGAPRSGSGGLAHATGRRQTGPGGTLGGGPL